MKRSSALIAGTVLWLGCLVLVTAAQEVQVPLDERGQLQVVDAELADRVGLFQEYTVFREARLFRGSDDAFVLVIRYQRDGEIVQVRQDMTAEEVSALRLQVSERLAADIVRPTLDHEGRVNLLRTAAAMSLLAYGPSLVAVLGIDEGAAAGTISLAAGGAGFFIPFYATQHRPVTRAAASLTTNASLLGYLHGMAAAGLVGGEYTTAEALAGAGLAASLGEAVLAYRLATSTNMTEGSAALMLSGGVFGAGFGLGIASIALGEGVDEDDTAIRVVSGVGLLGSALGAYAGYGLAGMEAYTRGDVRVLTTAGILGTYTGVAIAALADIESTRAGASLLVASTASGLAAGRILTRDRDFTRSNGNYVALSTTAGGLIGMAVATATDASDKVTAVLGTLGAAGGFATMYRGFSDDAARASRGSLELSVLPGSVLTGPMKSDSRLPLLGIRATF